MREIGRRLGGDWEEIGRRLGGDWEEIGRRSGGDREEIGRRLGGGDRRQNRTEQKDRHTIDRYVFYPTTYKGVAILAPAIVAIEAVEQ